MQIELIIDVHKYLLTIFSVSSKFKPKRKKEIAASIPIAKILKCTKTNAHRHGHDLLVNFYPKMMSHTLKLINK